MKEVSYLKCISLCTQNATQTTCNESRETYTITLYHHTTYLQVCKQAKILFINLFIMNKK